MTKDYLRNLLLDLAPDEAKEELVYAMQHKSFTPFHEKFDAFREGGNHSDDDLERMIRSLGWSDIKLELNIFEDLGEWRLGEEE
jgi:hypothetical protein